MKVSTSKVLKALNCKELYIPCIISDKIQLVSIDRFSELELPELENMDKQWERLVGESYYNKINNIEDDLEDRFAAIDKDVSDDFKNKLVDLRTYLVPKAKKTTESFEQEKIVIEGESQDLPETSQSISFLAPIKETKVEIKKEEAKETPKPEFKLELNNDNSLRDIIIGKCLRPSLDVNCYKDIMGNCWDVEVLKREIVGGEILADALISEEYPPYIANNNKQEIEYINTLYLEKKGKKAFE